MSTKWVAEQILSVRRTAEPISVTHNPRPIGVMLPGSATDAVWQWLSARPGRAYWQRRQIVAGTGRTGKSVDWALLFLRATGRVEVREDDRCSRYLRYRAVPGGQRE